MRKILLILFAVSSVVAVAQSLDPSRFNWPRVSGSGTPTSAGFSCGANYGQPYTDKSGPHYWVCTASGWFQVDTAFGSTQVNGTNLIAAGLGNFTSSPSITFTNPTGNQVQATVVNPGCQMQGVAGILNASNGSGGCASTPADYGTTSAGTFTWGSSGSHLTGFEIYTGVMGIVATSDTSLTLNSEVVCTASNGACAGTSTTFQVNGTPLSSMSTVNFQPGTNITLTNPSAGNILVTASATAATAFSALTSATNTAAAMLVGTGASLGTTGSGTIAATTATDLASYPTLCTAGQFSLGLSSGSNNCSTPSGSGISLTTTGTSGLATFSVSTLNVPHYAGSGANSDITSLTGLTTPLSPSRGGTGSAGLTGYMYGNGTSIVTASTTIPGSAISGNIPGNAANLTAAVTVPVGTSATTASPTGSSDTRIATKADVFNAIGGGLTKICSGTITLSGTLTSGSYASVGTATCTGLASTDIIIATFNGHIFTVGGWIPSTNGVLSVSLIPSANTITVDAENNTTLSQTIGSGAVLNYLVIR